MPKRAPSTPSQSPNQYPSLQHVDRLGMLPRPHDSPDPAPLLQHSFVDLLDATHNLHVLQREGPRATRPTFSACLRELKSEHRMNIWLPTFSAMCLAVRSSFLLSESLFLSVPHCIAHQVQRLSRVVCGISSQTGIPKANHGRSGRTEKPDTANEEQVSNLL